VNQYSLQGKVIDIYNLIKEKFRDQENIIIIPLLTLEDIDKIVMGDVKKSLNYKIN